MPTWTRRLDFPEYALEFTEDTPGIPAGEMREIVAGLTANMPELKIAAYFEAKPALLHEADHLVRARSQADGTIAVLASRWYAVEGMRFLHIATLLIGTRFRRSLLIRRLWALLFDRLRATAPGFPELIVLKTYNPASYTAMQVFSRVPGVTMYPKLDTEQDPMLTRLAAGAASVLSPGLPFRPETGVIVGGGGGVPADFYPSLPPTSDPSVYCYFGRVLTPSDRLLCLLSIPTEAAKSRICRAFGLNTRVLRDTG